MSWYGDTWDWYKEGMSDAWDKTGGMIFNDPKKASQDPLEQNVRSAEDLAAKIEAQNAARANVDAPQITAERTSTRDVDAPTIAPTTKVTAAQVGAPETVSVERVAPKTEAAQVAMPGQTAVTNATAERARAAAIDDTQGQQIRGQQMGYLDALQRQASGQGPSVAQAQYQRALADATAAQFGMAAQARGSQRAALMRAAMQQGSQMQQRAGLDTALMRAQEMTSAQQQLGGALANVRATDTSTAVQQAGLTQGANLTNAQLGTTTNLANAGAANTATQADANRTLAAGTTNATLTQGANLANTQAELATRELGVRTDEGNANRGLAASTTNAGLTQQAGLANAAAENARDTRVAELGTTVAMGNQASQNTAIAGNANRALSADLANQGVTMQAAGLNQQGTQFGTSALIQAAGLANNARTGVYAASAANAAAENAQNQAVFNGLVSGGTQLMTGGVGGGGGNGLVIPGTENRTTATGQAMAGAHGPSGSLQYASDARAKTAISRESERDVDSFLRALEAYSYKYKDPSEGPGVRHGVLAQDLEKSAIGRSLVHEDANGVKRVDTDGLTLALAGVLARKMKEGR